MNVVLAAECSNRCGRPARARGMCAVCYEFDRRNRLGHRTFSLELLKAKQRIVDLEVENTRLREALEGIATTDLSRDGSADLCYCRWFVDVAKQALRHTPAGVHA